MHYYQFNIGDYASHTKGLSPLEDIAYRRIMDEYYLHEQPLNGCSSDVARMIGMREYQDEVDYILSRFFCQDEDGNWRQKRIEQEISTYQRQLQAKSKAGRASGKARKNNNKEHVLNRCSTGDEQSKNTNSTGVCNQEPRTKNHKPENKEKKNKKENLNFSVWPENPSDQVWADWVRHRKAKKATVSQTVLKTMAKELHEATRQGYSVDYCLSEQIAAGWQGFKFDWLMNREASNGQSRPNQQGHRLSKAERLQRAQDEAFPELSGNGRVIEHGS